MNKVDTVSLTNMILPKPDAGSKGSWGNSAFKDIFSVNNSNNLKFNNKPNKSTKGIYSESQKTDKNSQISRKDSFTESNAKPIDFKAKKQDNTNNRIQNEKQVNEALKIENVSHEAEKNISETETKKQEELANSVNEQENMNIQDVSLKVSELIQSLVNAKLTPEQATKLEEAVNSMSKEIKDLTQENPRLILDFIKDNLQSLEKTLDLSKEQFQNIQSSVNTLLENVEANKGMDLDKFILFQKTQTQKFASNVKTEPRNEVVIGNIDDINIELNSLKPHLTVISGANTQASNAFAGEQNDDLNFVQTQIDEIEGFEITGGKIFSNSVLMNSAKKVEVKNTQFMQMISKITEEIKLTLDKNKSEITIKLQPETLGRLTVKINSENGLMNASFFAENDKARIMIENNMTELKKSLEKQGIQVQNLTVTVDQNQDELSKHRNIMEAQKYNKGNISIADFESLEKGKDDNPYILEDIFSELI